MQERGSRSHSIDAVAAEERPSGAFRRLRSRSIPGAGPEAPRMRLISSRGPEGPISSPVIGDPIMVSSASRARAASETRARVGRLIDCIQEGRLIEAVRDFYAPSAETSTSAMVPMYGLETRAGRGWSSAHPDAEWRSFEVKGIGVNGDTSFIECVLVFEASDGNVFSMEQVAVAQWRDGLIVKECLLPALPFPDIRHG
jgi:hypothetical protein